MVDYLVDVGDFLLDVVGLYVVDSVDCVVYCDCVVIVVVDDIFGFIGGVWGVYDV